MDFEVAIPEGYEVVETNEVTGSEIHGYAHFFRSSAQRHADQLNDQRINLLHRYVMEPVTPKIRQQTRLRRLDRWIVVPYRNKLRKKAYEPLDSDKIY